MIFFLIFLIFPIVQSSPTCQLDKLAVCAGNLQPLVNSKTTENDDAEMEKLEKICVEIEKCSAVFIGCAKSVKDDKDLQKFTTMMKHFPSHCDIARLHSNEDFKPCVKKLKEKPFAHCQNEPPRTCEEWTATGECVEKTVTGTCSAQNVESVKKLFQKHKSSYCK